MSHQHLRIDFPRFKERMNQLARIGALPGGGVCRLALSPEDKEARDLLQSWAGELGLSVEVDEVGNMFVCREGTEAGPAVMTGSHLDTVGTGGLFDGSLGVVAGMAVMEVLLAHNIRTRRPFKVANFTNEEGVRFTPDMMGSLAFKGAISAAELHQISSVDGKVVLGDELEKIGYKGNHKAGSFPVANFVELHIEQGPVLETENLQLAAVTKVQGIYWTEYTIQGRAAHAGTTPLSMRRDAGLVASQLNAFVREKAHALGAVGTLGVMEYYPNLINVIPERVRFTSDLRHTDPEILAHFQQQLDAHLEQLSAQEGTTFQRRELVRFQPVDFSEEIVSRIEEKSRLLGYSVKRMVSGAGHDAQMLAAICPTAMIFVPSVNGISHNVEEYTKDEDLERGANVLLHVLLDLLNR